MGKRSDFARVARDYYPTPPEAVAPLVPHLRGVRTFCEPCAGDGRLIRHLEAVGLKCAAAFDIEPRAHGIAQADSMELSPGPCAASWEADAIITNPPWDRKFLHPFIQRFAPAGPVWLLFDADWMHTRQSAAFLPLLHEVVSVGRVKWIEGSKQTGKDNAAWYRFGPPRIDRAVIFHGRAA
jgi:hypothetical protein